MYLCDSGINTSLFIGTNNDSRYRIWEIKDDKTKTRFHLPKASYFCGLKLIFHYTSYFLSFSSPSFRLYFAWGKKKKKKVICTQIPSFVAFAKCQCDGLRLVNPPSLEGHVEIFVHTRRWHHVGQSGPGVSWTSVKLKEEVKERVMDVQEEITENYLILFYTLKNFYKHLD